jgi:hypothetical protein
MRSQQAWVLRCDAALLTASRSTCSLYTIKDKNIVPSSLQVAAATISSQARAGADAAGQHVGATVPDGTDTQHKRKKRRVDAKDTPEQHHVHGASAVRDTDAAQATAAALARSRQRQQQREQKRKQRSEQAAVPPQQQQHQQGASGQGEAPMTAEEIFGEKAKRKRLNVTSWSEDFYRCVVQAQHADLWKHRWCSGCGSGCAAGS